MAIIDGDKHGINRDDDDAATNFEWQVGGRVAVMGVRRRGRGKVGARAAAKKTSRTAEKRDGGQKNGACGAGNAGKKRGRGFLGGPRAKHSVWGEGAPYGTVINDAMEAHRHRETRTQHIQSSPTCTPKTHPPITDR